MRFVCSYPWLGANLRSSHSVHVSSYFSTQRGDSGTDAEIAAAQLTPLSNNDTDVERRFLLAAVHEVLLKRNAKQTVEICKNVLSCQRFVDLAERRMKERKEAFDNLHNLSRQELLGTDKSVVLQVFEWQRDSLISRLRENRG